MRYDSALALRARGVGQRLGILRPVVRFYRRISGAAYEQKFDQSLLAEAAPGDTVWDIGANVGFYTRKLAEIVGPGGRVVAFEPAPDSVKRLNEAAASYPQISVAAVALSDTAGTATFYANADLPTNSFRESTSGGIASEVEVKRGDDFLDQFPPNIVKLDVEGYELEVMKGLSATLKAKTLRTMFIEVHFLELARRGTSNAPAKLCALLEQSGFTIKWVDPSHVVARRA